jgi:hypothetical protein
MAAPSSEDDYLAVADAIEGLPAHALAQLRLGPLEEPDCRICEVCKPLIATYDDAQTLLDFHDLGDDQLAEAAFDALGNDKRLTVEQRKGAAGYKRGLESMPERNVQRVTVESLAGNILWYRCLYVYTLAGWRP